MRIVLLIMISIIIISGKNDKISKWIILNLEKKEFSQKLLLGVNGQ